MNVKDAVRDAIAQVQELFKDEKISNLGLEEVNFDTTRGEWIVTVGFSRPWDYPSSALAILSNQTGQAKRTYKIVHIKDDDTHAVVEIRNRPARD